MIRVFVFFMLTWIGLSLHAKPIEIVLWHSLAGQLGAEVRSLAAGFNRTQAEYVIKPVYKGNYFEVMTSFSAAFRAGQAPALVQIFEVGTPIMLKPQGIIKPVEELMREQHLAFPKEHFFPAVSSYYSRDGQLMALPFNISVPVLFYNVDALAEIGYSSSDFPTTWDELERLSVVLKKAGYACSYTTAYPAWLILESFAALHGLPMINEARDKAVYDQGEIIAHVKRLRKWQKAHLFEYGGRGDDATALFTSGKCPLFSQSSGAYRALSDLVSFKIGVAPLPVNAKVTSTRFNNVVGGAALWVTAGQTSSVNQGIAQFAQYFLRPGVQQQWHQRTGYLPVGVHGVYKDLIQSSQEPTFLIAQSDWGKVQTRSVTGVQSHIRQINDETLEAVFAGIKEPENALHEAINRANHALERFNRNTQ